MCSERGRRWCLVFIYSYGAALLVHPKTLKISNLKEYPNAKHSNAKYSMQIKVLKNIAPYIQRTLKFSNVNNQEMQTFAIHLTLI